jgi:hypothetical protein
MTFQVSVSAGTLRADPEGGWVMPHAWTAEGVVVQGGEGTGAHVLHLSVAICVLNDLFREGVALGVPVSGVMVVADGDFDTASWVSTGITYRVQVDSYADPDEVARVVERVDEVAEIPRVLRAGMSVEHLCSDVEGLDHR